jgi:hypothetical protein
VIRSGFSFVKSPLFQPSLPLIFKRPPGIHSDPGYRCGQNFDSSSSRVRLATLNGHAAHHVLQQSLLKLRLLESQSLVRKKSLPNWPGSLRLSRQIHRCFQFRCWLIGWGVTFANLTTRSRGKHDLSADFDEIAMPFDGPFVQL